MAKPIFVLGTGLSHNGSAVLLKDGHVLVGIEKERLTRVKHDGANDSLAVQYCLDTARITVDDLAVIVQCANFEVPDRNSFAGERVWSDNPNVPLVSISHHLAHAYSAIGTCPFEEFHILVVDGCGSPFDQCVDIDNGLADDGLKEQAAQQRICEKDSFYHWDGEHLHVLWKDFSEMASRDGVIPTTKHSIGGFYASISSYCFGSDTLDLGKLMGLAPYGKRPHLAEEAFDWKNNRLFLRDNWIEQLTQPSMGFADFKQRFTHYSDVALWAQLQVEEAITELVQRRYAQFQVAPLAYSGGVALNAVANGKLLSQKTVTDLYLEPAAGDNGLALGCAYFGWIELVQQQRQRPSGNTCFGRTYSDVEIEDGIRCLLGHQPTEQNPDSCEPPFASEMATGANQIFPTNKYSIQKFEKYTDMLEGVAEELHQEQVIGWFQAGSEFGPRALGHRSILASPGVPGMRDRINSTIKFREDFRPFAPAVLKEDAATFFQNAWESPYMILVDQIKPEWKGGLNNVIHLNGSSRVQTVDNTWNAEFYALLHAVKKRSGYGILLNTSFNKKGQPIVERPQEAVSLFEETTIDVLVMGQWIIKKLSCPL
jgi:carbamoyltransferase